MKIQRPRLILFSSGADGGGRTHTLLRVPDFESSASANSATSATGSGALRRRRYHKRDTPKSWGIASSNSSRDDIACRAGSSYEFGNKDGMLNHREA